MPVEVPRHLYHTDVYMRLTHGHICEGGDPEAAVLMAPAGTLYAEEEATRLGIMEYLEAHPDVKSVAAEVKAVEQAEVEDKAVTGPMEEKTPPPSPPDPADDPGHPPTGVEFPPEGRRQGGSGRRGA